jgi:hypothetical protein
MAAGASAAFLARLPTMTPAGQGLFFPPWHRDRPNRTPAKAAVTFSSMRSSTNKRRRSAAWGGRWKRPRPAWRPSTPPNKALQSTMPPGHPGKRLGPSSWRPLAMRFGASSSKGRLAGFATKGPSSANTACPPRFATAWACSPAAPHVPAASRRTDLTHTASLYSPLWRHFPHSWCRTLNCRSSAPR